MVPATVFFTVVVVNPFSATVFFTAVVVNPFSAAVFFTVVVVNPFSVTVFFTVVVVRVNKRQKRHHSMPIKHSSWGTCRSGSRSPQMVV